MALIDNSAWMNVITPSFVKKRGLVVGSIQDLKKHHRHIPVSCSGGYYTKPTRYVMFWVKIPRICTYDEDQVALVIRDRSEFSWRVLVIIGTPTIDWIIWVLKEMEMESAPIEWQRARRGLEVVHDFFAQAMNPWWQTQTRTPWIWMRKSSSKVNAPFQDLSPWSSWGRLTRRWWWGTNWMLWPKPPM